MARRSRPASAACSATSSCRTGRRASPTPATSSSGRWRGRPTSASPSTPTPRSSSSSSRTGRRTAASPSRSTRAGTSTTPRTAPRHDFRRNAIMMLEAMGISVEYSHHEGAPGQQEIDLRYADALTTADNIMTFRLVMKEVALEQGVLRLLHAEAVHRVPGLGHAHPHVAVRGRPQRLLRAGRGVPAVQGRPGVHRRAAAALRGDHRGVQPVGQLLQAAVGQRRLAAGAGGEAPSYICWGHNNRSALVRVPMYKPHKGHSTRIEFRSLDSAVQPLPGVRGDPRRRAQGHRGGVRAAARAPRTTCGR